MYEPIPRAAVLLASALAAAPLAAQTVLIQGPGTNDDRLAVLSVSGAPAWTPEWAQAIEILAVDACARTPLDELTPTRPRLRMDVPGAARLELPGGRGSLFHHRRVAADGAVVYGWFRVDPAGTPHLLVELPTPTDTPVDPFLARAAVARDGTYALVATRLDAGGDVLELPLTGGAAIARTAGIPPLEVLPNGLGCGDGFAVAVCRDRVLRWTPGVAGDAQAAPCAGPATWFGDGLASSANGRFVAFFAAAQGPEQSRPFVLGSAGPALPAGSTATRYMGSGAAPDALDGPWIAVSDDGAHVAWRSWGVGGASAYRGELYVGRAAAEPAPAEHVTRDEVFEPYLDEVAVFVFLPGGRLLFAAGEAPTTDGAGIQQADFFVLDAAAGAASTVNLTNSSGNPFPPFLQQPTLVPSRILWAPEAQAYLVDLPPGSAQHGRLLRIGLDGVETLHEETAGLPIAERSGVDLLLAVADEGLEEHEFQLWPATLLGEDQDVASSVDNERALSLAIGPGGRAALVTRDDAGAQTLWGVMVPAGSAVRLRSWPQGFGDGVTFLPDGTLVASLHNGAGSLVVAWPPGARMTRLIASDQRLHVLPGGAR